MRHGAFVYKNAMKLGKNAPFLCIGHFFRSPYVVKNPFGGIFLLNTGHVFVPRGCQPWTFPRFIIPFDDYRLLLSDLASGDPRGRRSRGGGGRRRVAGLDPAAAVKDTGLESSSR